VTPDELSRYGALDAQKNIEKTSDEALVEYPNNSPLKHPKLST
jgi:hypothetical protein